MNASPRRDELDQFKTEINLCEYAASRGFVLDRRQSSRCSAVMRHPNGDKVIISRSATRAWVYFNVHAGDSGSIIDFVQARDRVSLGEVRKELRPWLRGGFAPLPASPTLGFALEPSEHDAAHVLAAWLKAKPIGKTHHYLESERHIPPATLMDPIFRDRVRIDHRRNAVIPHFNHSGLCGFELKNNGFTGFSPGGVKGLACSRPRETDREMIICETAVDMLSLAALEGTYGKRFFSTAGQISPAQSTCLRAAADKMPANSMVTLAVDNDEGGRKLAVQIREALASTTLVIREHVPPTSGEDWNDVLRCRTPTDGNSPTLS